MTVDIEFQGRLREMLVGEKAKWSTAEQGKFPDSCFAHICKGGEKDSEGKTTPRSLRKLVYKDADGTIDAAHTRNALARLNQVECDGEVISEDLQDKIRAKLQKALASAKKAEKSLSYTRTNQIVSRAFDVQFGSLKSSDGYSHAYWVYEVFDDAVILASWDEFDTYYKVAYTVDKDNNVEFKPQEKWQRGTYAFTPSK